MKKLTYRFTAFIYAATLAFMSIAVLGAVFTVNSNANMFVWENNPLGNSTVFASLAIVAGSAVGIAVLRRLFIFIDNADKKRVKRLTLLMFAVFSLISLFFVLGINALGISDTLEVEEYAMKLATGERQIINTDNWYFAVYSNNNLLVLIMSVYYRLLLSLNVKNIIRASVALSGMCVVIGQIFAYKTAKLLRGEKYACKFMCISLFNPTLYLVIPWVYSASICLPFMSVCSYAGLAFFKNLQKSKIKAALYGALLAVMSVTGYFIRPVVLIVAMAFFVCFILYILRNRLFNKRILALAMCIIIVFSMAFFAVKAVISANYESYDENYPLNHWIAIGIYPPSSGLRYEQYTYEFKTKEEKISACNDLIKARLNEISALDFVKHIAFKVQYNWSQATTSLNSRYRMMNQNITVPYYKYLVWGKVDILVLYGQISRACLLLLLVIHAFKKLKSKSVDIELFPVLTVFGGALFYLIWEAKPPYSIPFLYFIALSAVFGVDILNKSTQRNIKREHKHISRMLLIKGTALTAVVITAVSGMNVFAVKNNNYKDWSIYTVRFAGSRLEENTVEGFKTLSQDFYTDHEFNRIKIKTAEPNGSAKYLVEIYDDSGNAVYSKRILSNKIKQIKENYFLYLRFDTINPNGEKRKYTVKITDIRNKGALGFICETNRHVGELYEGDFCTDGKSVDGKLIMDVFYEHNETYTKPYKYIIAVLFIILLYILASAHDIRAILSSKKKRTDND